MRHLIAIGALCLALAALTGVLISLHRADNARRYAAGRADTLQEAISSLRTNDYGSALELCRQRTESLHGVLEVLVSSGIGWPERVRLPDPPPGWAPWPALGHRDRPDRDE